MSDRRSADADRGGGPAGNTGLRAILYSNFTIAAGLAAFCAVVYALTLRIPEVPSALAQGMQPSSYPLGVLAAILLFTALMLFETRRTPTEVPAPVPRLAYVTIAAMVAALAVATWLDFFMGMVLFVAVCVPLWGMRRYLLAVLYAVALCGVLYVMFATFLGVRFPRGALSGLLS